MHNENNKQKGYTIIETMIAVSLFLVVVMAGMGALLNANLLHSKSENMRSIIDNLSFIMEDMSRNLRTGYDYRCINSPFDLDSDHIIFPQSSGSDCWGIAFESQDGAPYDPDTGVDHYQDQWVYKIEDGKILKSTGGGDLGTYVQLTPEELVIDENNSSFLVSGAESGDGEQPFVTIKLAGTITYKGTETPFSLRTSVSQRAIDNL